MKVLVTGDSQRLYVFSKRLPCLLKFNNTNLLKLKLNYLILIFDKNNFFIRLYFFPTNFGLLRVFFFLLINQKVKTKKKLNVPRKLIFIRR